MRFINKWVVINKGVLLFRAYGILKYVVMYIKWSKIKTREKLKYKKAPSSKQKFT